MSPRLRLAGNGHDIINRDAHFLKIGPGKATPALSLELQYESLVVAVNLTFGIRTHVGQWENGNAAIIG